MDRFADIRCPRICPDSPRFGCSSYASRAAFRTQGYPIGTDLYADRMPPRIAEGRDYIART